MPNKWRNLVIVGIHVAKLIQREHSLNGLGHFKYCQSSFFEWQALDHELAEPFDVIMCESCINDEHRNPLGSMWQALKNQLRVTVGRSKK